MSGGPALVVLAKEMHKVGQLSFNFYVLHLQ